MLLAGELDAAILGAVPTEDNLKPVIPDPEAAAKAWRAKYRAIQINHMVAIKNDVKNGDEIYRLLLESRNAAGKPEMNPYGVDENRRNLEVAIDCVHKQRMIPQRYTVEELFK
jgi:4,5-dihydroxyphthalate decarboxylase